MKNAQRVLPLILALLLKMNPTVTSYSYSRWESMYARFLNEKVRSKANEIKCLRAEPEQGIRASLYRIMVKLQYKMTKKFTALNRRLFW